MKLVSACAVTAILIGCSGGASAPPLAPSSSVWALSRHASHHAVGLGDVLTSQSGQIFGFDIDQNGNDGALATASNVETFDQDTGKITTSFPKQPPSGTSYSFAGIAAGDAGLVTR